ncbi:MAG: efflux RND transporter periplasmic adaptor subunit [Candidatus Latescibacterota bacterium]
MKKRHITIVVAVVVVLITAGVFLSVAGGEPKVATYKVTRGEFVIDIRQPGELDATRSETVALSSRRWNNVRIIKLVPDGTMVKEKDFLIQFDTTDAEKQVIDRGNELEQAKAEHASTMASIESNMKQLENSYQSQLYTFESDKLTYELAKFEADLRRREMELTFKKSELSLEQAKQKIESQKVIDKASTARSELRVRQAQERLKEAQEGLAELTVRAPKAGMVVLLEIYGQNGRAKVKEGDSPYPRQPIISIPDLSQMKVRTKVNEVDISRVHRNQPVVISLDALPGPLFSGKVSTIAALARREGDSEVKVFDVEVLIDEAHKELKPGMTAQTKIVTGKIDSVIYVPLEAVFDKGDTTVVYVKNHGFERRPVKLGSKNSDYVIIEQGLKEKEEVALRDPTVKLEDIGKETAGEKESKNGGSSQGQSQGRQGGGGPRGGGNMGGGGGGPRMGR